MASSAGSRVSPASEHHPDPDGERNAEVLVDAERGQQQAQQGEDHRSPRRGDRLADAGERVGDGVVRRSAGSQLLTNPEDEEQAVVRPRPEHEDDEQQLRELGDLQAVGAESADETVGDDERECRRDEGDQGREDRAEDEEQQHDDEKDREVLDAVAGRR